MQVHWSERQNQHESLAVALQAVLASQEPAPDYDELVATLGLGAAVVATAEDGLGWWHTYGRDACLDETARRYGLRLRELHPGTAASGLTRSAAYARHFRDSYLPLIADAIAHDQVALAWRGWPAPRDRLWGVVTEVRDETLCGYTLWHNGQPMPLTGPAHQIYTVEGRTRPDADALEPASLFRHVAQQACRVWDGTWINRREIQTGAAAYQAWQRALREPDGDEAAELSLSRQHSQAAVAHSAARASLAAWLRRVAGSLSPEHRRLAQAWANTCEHVSRRFRPYHSPAAVQEALGRHDGLEQMCEAIAEAQNVEGEQVHSLKAAV